MTAPLTALHGVWAIPQAIKDGVAAAWGHHMTETQKLSRLIWAKQHGLSSEHVHDFPATRNTDASRINVNSTLSTAVTAASVLGGVGLGAAGLHLLRPADAPKPPAAAVQSPPPLPDPDPARAQIELFYRDPQQGLVPITGAASGGAELTPKPQ
jgi:hypothetical protein